MKPYLGAGIKNLEYQVAHFLSEENFRKLEAAMFAQRLKKGSHLFWEGEKADRLFYVFEGQIRATKSTEDGKQLILYFLQKGDMLGEIGGFGEPRYTFSAEVTENATVGVARQEDLDLLLHEEGDFAVEFMKWLNLMQRTAESKFRDMILFGKNGALASTFIRLAHSYGIEDDQGIRISIKLTNGELANIIGTARESVNRLIQTYKEDGALSYENGYIVIHDLEYFKSIVCCPNCPPEICHI